MANSYNWNYKNEEFKLIKYLNASFSDITFLASELDIDIQILLESFDLEQYPYFKQINSQITTIILDIPTNDSSISIFSTPIQIIMTENKIYLISRSKNHQIETLEKKIVFDNNIDVMTLEILVYYSDLFLQVLKKLKKRLDIITITNYKNQSFIDRDEIEISKMKIEVMHYISSLKTNLIVLKQWWDKTKSTQKEHEELYNKLMIETSQALDIAQLYEKLIENLLQSFDLYENRKVEKRVDRLTILTIALTIPSILFSFFGMNVALPFENDKNAWIITILISLIGIFTVSILNKQKK